MDFGNTKTPSMHRRLSSATLSQLAFAGESNPNFLCMYEWDVWGVQIRLASLTSDGSTPRDGREHSFSFGTLLSLMAPRPFLSHIPGTAYAGGQSLMRGWYVSSYQFWETRRGDERRQAVPKPIGKDMMNTQQSNSTPIGRGPGQHRALNCKAPGWRR